MNQINVLLIEDDADDVFLIQKIVEKSGGLRPPVYLKSAATMRDGLRVVDEGNVDIVLLDLSLPDSRGLDSLKLVLAQAPSLPIIILTALDDEVTALGALGYGAQDYIVKDHISPTYFKRSLLYAIERQRIKKDLEQLNTRLQELAQVDPLTGLLNRRGLQEILMKYVHRNSRQRDLMAILIDLDNFKQINESLGHKGGDVALTEIAHRINSCIRSTDYAVRVGGDEFMILLPQTRQAEGMGVAEKIRLAISAAPFALSQGTQYKVTASLGLITVEPEISSIDELLEESHAALARSKGAGKNNVFLKQTSQKEDRQAQNTLEVQQRLRHKSSFRVLGQGIFRLSDGKKVGCELLSRSNIEYLEMPDDFFRYSQEANFLTTVDHLCFRNCQSTSLKWADNNGHMQYHLNVFPSTLLEVPIGVLMNELQTHEVFKGRYCIEISEQQIIGDPTYLIPVVEQLKLAGIKVAIDDVGFGRSCLESLILLEPDIVKIDKGCVANIAGDPARVRSLKRLINVARSLETEVIAEGIESGADLEVLKGLGVEYGQGFYFDKPQELSEAAA